MKVLSINVGRPREIESRGKRVRTSIFKDPVKGPVWARTLNLDGDEQSDLSVHGGPAKAVYAYPSEHYPWWRAQLPDLDLPWGAFGENLTTEGLEEESLHIGDRLGIGAAELMVTQPRIPCFKLGVRFGRLDMVKRFQQSGRSGFYCAVVREGEIAVGDTIQLISADPRAVSVTDIVRLFVSGVPDQALLRRATEVAALPESWREYFRSRHAKPLS